MEAAHQCRFRQRDVRFVDEFVEAILRGVHFLRCAFIEGKNGVAICRRTDHFLRDFHGLLAAAVELALFVTGQSQVEQLVERHRARRTASQNPDVIDEKIADGNHLVPKLEHFADTQIAFGLLNGKAIGFLHPVFQPRHLGIKRETIVLVVQEDGVGLSSLGFQQVERSGHDAMCTGSMMCQGNPSEAENYPTIDCVMFAFGATF